MFTLYNHWQNIINTKTIYVCFVCIWSDKQYLKLASINVTSEVWIQNKDVHPSNIDIISWINSYKQKNVYFAYVVHRSLKSFQETQTFSFSSQEMLMRTIILCTHSKTWNYACIMFFTWRSDHKWERWTEHVNIGPCR